MIWVWVGVCQVLWDGYLANFVLVVKMFESWEIGKLLLLFEVLSRLIEWWSWFSLDLNLWFLPCHWIWSPIWVSIHDFRYGSWYDSSNMDFSVACVMGLWCDFSIWIFWYEFSIWCLRYGSWCSIRNLIWYFIVSSWFCLDFDMGFDFQYRTWFDICIVSIWFDVDMDFWNSDMKLDLILVLFQVDFILIGYIREMWN